MPLIISPWKCSEIPDASVFSASDSAFIVKAERNALDNTLTPCTRSEHNNETATYFRT